MSVKWTANNCTVYDQDRNVIAYTGAAFDSDYQTAFITLEDCQRKAQLIATVPDLLECLNLLVRDTWGTSTLDLRHRCEIVLAKAEGRKL